MAWYYYTGNVPRSIPVKKGLSKVVTRCSRVEILEMTLEVQVLIRKKMLRRTGVPKGALSVAEDPVVDQAIESVVEPPKMARSVAEKGKTKSAKIEPVSSGKVEMTDGEKIAKIKGKTEKSEKAEKKVEEDELRGEEVVEKVDQAEEMKDDNSKKGKRKKRRR